MSEITRMGAAQLGRLVHRGELAPSEIVEAHLRRIEEVNPTINAITDLQADRAREQAVLADQARGSGNPCGPLHGVPLTIKSSIAAEGCRHECGTRLRAGEIAQQDASVVKRLKNAGAIILGTTNVPEFLMAYETDNDIYGRTNSPLDPALTPGGSSGGDSAAVAGGCSAGSFGSDAGGSVRVPAHFCGLYGLKPTPGTIPRTGHWPAVAGPSTTLAAVGPLAKTAEDLDLFLEITSGHDPTDISSFPPGPPTAPQSDELRNLKIGWFEDAWETPVTAETRRAVHDAAHALRERGFRVERIELHGFERAPRTWWLLFGTCLKTLIEASIPPDYRLHALSYDAMATGEQEAATAYKDLLMAWVVQDQLRFKLHERMREYPILLGPVSAVPAFPHRQRIWSIDGQKVGYPGVFVYSQVFNLLGVPAATAPVGRSPNGLPIGVQIIGPPYEDRTVTAIVRELAAAFRGS